MTKTADNLMEKLTRTLPRAKTPRKKSWAHMTETKAADNPTGAVKLSVSLYPPDLRRLDEIRAYMLKTRGVRKLSDSEALRLACRRLEIDAQLAKLYDEMRLEDGRRM